MKRIYVVAAIAAYDDTTELLGAYDTHEQANKVAAELRVSLATSGDGSEWMGRPKFRYEVTMFEVGRLKRHRDGGGHIESLRHLA